MESYVRFCAHPAKYSLGRNVRHIYYVERTFPTKLMIYEIVARNGYYEYICEISLSGIDHVLLTQSQLK
jgi:hypothetical protein